MGWGGESKRCEGEQESRRERDVTAATANEGCGEGRREREETKGGIVAQIRKQQSRPVPGGQALPSSHTESEEGGGRFDFYLPKKPQLSPRLPSSLLFPSTQPVWSRRGLSASTDKARDQSAGRATVPTALLPALPPCITLPHTCTPKCSHRHAFRELSLVRTHLHADEQAAGRAHTPLPLSVRGAVLLILV